MKTPDGSAIPFNAVHSDHIVVSGLCDGRLTAWVPTPVSSRGERKSAISHTLEPRQGFCAWVFPKCEIAVFTMTLDSFPDHNGNWALDQQNPVGYATGYVLVVLALLG